MLKKLLQGGWLIHVFFVMLFLVVPTISFVRPPGEHFFALTKIFIQNTTSNFIVLCFFYINYYLLLPKYYFKKQYLLYLIFVFLFVSIAFALPFYIGKYFPHEVMGAEYIRGQKPPLFMHFHEKKFSLASFIFDEFRRHLGLFFTAIFSLFF
ncbi:MAG: hypothetical protein EAZ58_12235 [Flavobacterium sp.]|nr:MAG: hypothetical protein EAZ58_12235 [Flavobacterium sp.]